MVQLVRNLSQFAEKFFIPIWTLPSYLPTYICGVCTISQLSARGYDFGLNGVIMLSSLSKKARTRAFIIQITPNISEHYLFTDYYSSWNINCILRSELGQWLWPKLLRKSLREFMEFRNGVRMRKDNEKAGPSGMSRNEAFSLPENWGGRNCLLEVDMVIIRELKEAMGGNEILDFVSAEFSQRAQAAYDTLDINDLNLENVWYVFTDLCPLMF